MQSARQRIIDFVENQNIANRDFLKKTGLKRGILDKNHVNSGTSDYNLAKILDAYPKLSALWLVTGHGKMLNEIDKFEDKKPYKYLEDKIDLIEAQKQIIASLKKENAELKQNAKLDDNIPAFQIKNELLFGKLFSKVEEIECFIELIRLKIEIDLEGEELQKELKKSLEEKSK